MDGILVARQDFFYSDANGAPHHVRRGTMFQAGHPVTVGREDLFDEIAKHVEHDEATKKPEPPKKAATPAAPKLKLGGD